MKDRPFSLIELLVTVAIIGILMTILLPSLNKAKETSRGMGCMSNIKQTGVVHHSYAGDFGGYIRTPYSHLGFDHSTGADWYCYDYLAQQYLGKKYALEAKVFQCPSAPPLVTVGTYYGVNCFLFSHFQNGWLLNRMKRVSDLKNPSRSSLCVENNLHAEISVYAQSYYSTMPRNPGIMFRHMDKAAVVFNDLHAKLNRPREVPCQVSYPERSYAQLAHTFFFFDSLIPGYENTTTPGL